MKQKSIETIIEKEGIEYILRIATNFCLKKSTDEQTGATNEVWLALHQDLTEVIEENFER